MKRFFKICLIFLLGLLIMIGVNGCMLENKDDFQFSENDIEKVEQAFKEYNNNTQKSLTLLLQNFLKSTGVLLKFKRSEILQAQSIFRHM